MPYSREQISEARGRNWNPTSTTVPYPGNRSMGFRRSDSQLSSYAWHSVGVRWTCTVVGGSRSEDVHRARISTRAHATPEAS
jgi:hypothetical protein